MWEEFFPYMIYHCMHEDIISFGTKYSRVDQLKFVDDSL